MAAPFPLPDTVTVFDPTGANILAGDIPARVVPRWKEQDLLVTSQLNTIKYGWQYWVDMESWGPVEDGAGQWYSLAMQHGFTEGCLIEFSSALYLYKLRVIWFEERWTGTDKYHVRAYCRRQERTTN